MRQKFRRQGPSSSVVISREANYVLYPESPGLAAHVAFSEPFQFDIRLFSGHPLMSVAERMEVIVHRCEGRKPGSTQPRELRLLFRCEFSRLLGCLSPKHYNALLPQKSPY